MTDFITNWLLVIIALSGSGLKEFQLMAAFGSWSCRLHSNMRSSPFRMWRVFWDVIVVVAEDNIDNSRRPWNTFLQQLSEEIFFWPFRVQCQAVIVRARTVQIIELHV